MVGGGGGLALWCAGGAVGHGRAKAVVGITDRRLLYDWKLYTKVKLSRRWFNGM